MKKKLKKKRGEEMKVERLPSITSSSNGKKKTSPNKSKNASKEAPSTTGKYSTQELAGMNNLSRSYSITFSSDLLSELQQVRNDALKEGGGKRKK